MKTPTLLEQARAFTHRTTGTAALSILPLAAAALALPSNASAVVSAAGPIFTPASPTYNPYNNLGVIFNVASGSTAGSAALPTSNNVTGEKSFGSATFGILGGTGGSFSNYTAVSINGSPGASLNNNFTLNQSVPVAYKFTLSQTGTVTLGTWSLIFDIQVGGQGSLGSGVADNFTTVPITGSGTGTFSGTANIVIQNLGTTLGGNQTPFVGYNLRFVEAGNVAGSLNNGSFSIDIPQNSFDFNAVAVPEPSTWSMLGAGVLVLGAFAARRRKQQAAALS
ncbi:MAG: PEP-CTERM sorting domain-containing protein [Verrucomicrobia bacterium]|nr:PEP-CTERM sorting domain-containing protein [Verrucomicrobiota bacterium]